MAEGAEAAGGWLAQVSAAVGAWEETEIADTAEQTGARKRRLCGEVGAKWKMD